MNTTDYQKQAQVTLSHSFFGEYIERAAFIDALNEAIVACAKLDKIKKTLFYGRDLEANQETRRKPFATLGSMVMTGREETILHALLGTVTEAGEQAEILRDYIHNGGIFDEIHLIEESGDILWYQAVLAEAIEIPLGEILQMNIDKLRTLYAAKFEAAEANERNLSAERQAISAKAPSQSDSRSLSREIERTTMVDAMTPETYPRADNEQERAITAQMRDGLHRWSDRAYSLPHTPHE